MILKSKISTRIPIEADCISPESFSGKSVEDVKNLSLFYGNKRKKIGDIFEVSKGQESSDEIIIQGDVSNVKQIGAGMSTGKISITGNVGMHLGRQMKGGEITVQGNVGDWAGAEMKGGLIRIKGDAGSLLGAAYRGSKSGMKGGIILVEGSAGHEVGAIMKRGIIAVSGNLATFAGAHMKGGTILCFGKMEARAGAEMDRGTIVAFNEVELLPTFKYGSTFNPNFLRIFLSELKKYGMPVKPQHITGPYSRYSGDLSSLGRGEILVWKGGG